MPNSSGALQLCCYSFKAMGSPCDIRIYAPDSEAGVCCIKIAVAEIVGLERKYSRYIQGNELDHLNQAANQGGSITVSDEMLALLNYANACYEQSDGLFDVTSGVLREVWDFKNEITRIPTNADLEKMLVRVGWQHVSINGHRVSFNRKNMALDFGGIVKEYAADCAARLLQDQGIQFGLVNLGGDIKAIGPHPNGLPWKIKIRDPNATGKHLTEMELYHEGLATSGDYERCIKINGKHYSHILSPKTGWPVQGLASVSVKAPQCVVAGSTATIAMLKGSAGRQWLESLGLEFYAVERC